MIFERLGECPDFRRWHLERTKKVDPGRPFIPCFARQRKADKLTLLDGRPRDPARQKRHTHPGDRSPVQRFKIVGPEYDALARFPCRRPKNIRPTEKIVAMELIEDTMLAKRICTFRHAVVLKICRARHDDAIKRRQLGGYQRAVLKITHPHHQIEPLCDRVGQPLGQIQFDMQARIFPCERCQYGDGVAFSECRETGDPQHATDRAIESGNLAWVSARSLSRRWARSKR